LENEPDLIEMMRVLGDDPFKIRGELSCPELIQLEETTGSENPEAPPPQIRSPGEISAQPEITRIVERMSIQNPFSI
jgi:hypothetical protein